MVHTSSAVGSSHERKHGWQAWLVVFSASLFFFYEFIQLNMFNALEDSLILAFHIQGAQLGTLSAYYFYADVLFLFVAGIILDRFSPRWIITLAMGISVLCTFFFSRSTVLWQAEICRFATGMGAAFCLLGAVRIASRWFPPQRMALVVGLIVTFAMLGGMLAQTPLTKLVKYFGWRQALVLDAIFGLVLWVVMMVFVRDYPKGYEHQFSHENKELHHLGLLHTITKTVGNFQNWLGGLYTSLVNLPIFLIGAMWGGLYLQQVRGLTATEASYVTSMIYVGTIVGSPLLGWFSDYIGLRRLPMIWGAIFALVIILVIMYVPHLTLVPLMILVFLLGLATSAQVISYPLIAESNSPSLTGSAEGLASTLIMAGGFLQPVYGWLMERQWNHKIVDGLPIYSLHDYRSAMMIMPVAFVLGLIVALVVKETYCRNITQQQD